MTNATARTPLETSPAERRAMDTATATAAAPGTVPSFTSLVSDHHARIFSFVYRYVGNRQDAEDITQDSFVKAFRHYHRYDPKYPVLAWLYTIARRTVYNHYRSAKPTAPLDFDIAAAAPAPDEQAEETDKKRTLWELASQLKENYREVLVLKYIDDLSVEEISRVLNKTQTNVKILLFRARNQLRKLHGR